MKTAKLQEEFRRIVKKDTTLDAQEQYALLNLYVNLNDAAELALDRDMIMVEVCKAMGAIEYLMFMGKIPDDEDLHMLLNELEAEADRNRARIEEERRARENAD